MKSNSAGTKLFVDGVKVGGVTAINGVEITAESIDVTDLDNETGFREKIPGFKEVGDITADGFLDSDELGESGGQKKCSDLLDSGDVVDCEIRFPRRLNVSWYFKAGVTRFATGADVGNGITFGTTLTPSGKPSLEATRTEPETESGTGGEG